MRSKKCEVIFSRENEEDPVNNYHGQKRILYCNRTTPTHESRVQRIENTKECLVATTHIENFTGPPINESPVLMKRTGKNYGLKISADLLNVEPSQRFKRKILSPELTVE